MERNFNHNVVKLQKEIYSISNGINKVRFKNHRTMSNIVEKLKQISKNISISNNESEEHKCNLKVLKNGKKSKNTLFSYKKKEKSDKKHISNQSTKNTLINQEMQNEMQNYQIPTHTFTPSNYNKNILKLIKNLKNNENNDDDILLSENNVINNISDDFRKCILTEKINFNNKKQITVENKNDFSNNNKNNLSGIDKKMNYYNNLNTIKTINNYCNPSNYYNKTNNNFYSEIINSGQKIENNSIRTKFLKNIRDEIEDINFTNNNKNINKVNFLNNNNLYIEKEINSSNLKHYYKLSPNQKISNINEYLINNSKYNNEKTKQKKNIFLYKNKFNQKKNKNRSSDINNFDRNINNNCHDNKTFFKFNNDFDNNNIINNIKNNNNKKYIINNNKIIKVIDFESHKINDDYFNKDINNGNINKKTNNFIQNKKNDHHLNDNNKYKIYTQTKSKIYLNKNSLIIKNLLKYKEKKNLDDLINWIKYVKQYKNFVNTLKQLYNKYNKNKNNQNSYDIILSWINKTIDKKKEIKIYESYCKNIINLNKLNNIEEFKFFMNQVLNKNKKNKEFLKDMKKICQDNFVPKAINANNTNEIYCKNKFLFKD